MSGIRGEDVPALLLRMVPETPEHIAGLYEMPAGEAVVSEAARFDTYVLLQEAFAEPIVVPELRKATPDPELMYRCFQFVDILVHSSSAHFTGAVYFQVLEEFFDEDLLEKAISFLQEGTRERTAEMLTGHELPVSEGLLR
ncbi:hypothetical protein ACFC0M_18215 [Streptomyces sp. NPDC056149]|uniref:hypothetical protein n=1 Tax=Streptomyces sp. NPDC056149 TaxID=3345728 RepID=UPI0035E33CFF